jgi:hypothetical protein
MIVKVKTIETRATANGSFDMVRFYPLMVNHTITNDDGTQTVQQIPKVIKQLPMDSGVAEVDGWIDISLIMDK